MPGQFATAKEEILLGASKREGLRQEKEREGEGETQGGLLMVGFTELGHVRFSKIHHKNREAAEKSSDARNARKLRALALSLSPSLFLSLCRFIALSLSLCVSV